MFSTPKWHFFFIWKGNSDRIQDVVAQRTNRVHPVNSAMIPSVEDDIQMYTNAGGTITRDSSFGIDPLASSDALINQRETEFIRDNLTFEEIYSNIINGNGSLMVSAVLSLINITRNLSPWLFWNLRIISLRLSLIQLQHDNVKRVTLTLTKMVSSILF